MGPLRTNFECFNFNNNNENLIKLKNCICFIDKNRCPCHAPKESVTPAGSTNTPECDKKRPSKFKSSVQSLNLSFTSLDSNGKVPATTGSSQFKLFTSGTSTSLDFNSDVSYKNEIFRAWCSKKAREKRMQKEQEDLNRESARRFKATQSQQGKTSFEIWLTSKKVEEERRKMKKEKLIEEKKEEERKRLHESEVQYQIWLKRKRELELEKKLAIEKELMQKEEEKRKRMEENVKAYELWLEQSKNKPKPVTQRISLSRLTNSRVAQCTSQKHFLQSN